MAISYLYDEIENIMNIRLYEDFTLRDIRSYLNYVLGAEEIRPGFIEVVDFSSISNYHLSSDDVFGLIETFERIKDEKGYLGSILYVPTDLSYGMANMFARIFGSAVPLRLIRNLDERVEGINTLRQNAQQDSLSNQEPPAELL